MRLSRLRFSRFIIVAKKGIINSVLLDGCYIYGRISHQRRFAYGEIRPINLNTNEPDAKGHAVGILQVNPATCWWA